MDNSQQLAAMFNEHEITDQDGQVQGDDTSAESAEQETTEIEEPTEAEKPAESEVKESQPSTDDDENQPVEDEEGKKYVPEKRFKAVYAEKKEAERRAKALEDQLKVFTAPRVNQPKPVLNKTDVLETEMLFNQYPQFDPNSTSYDEDLDRVAATIYLSGGATTKTEAARQALGLARKLQSKTTSIKEETKTFKRSVSEGNLVKPGQRVEAQFNPNDADIEDMEKYLRSTGNWGSPTS